MIEAHGRQLPANENKAKYVTSQNLINTLDLTKAEKGKLIEDNYVFLRCI